MMGYTDDLYGVFDWLLLVFEFCVQVTANQGRYPVRGKVASSVEFLQVPSLVPRAHVSFGQRQDTELCNNQFPDSKILGLPVSRRMRALV